MNNKANTYRSGFYSAIITAILTAITFGIAICTPPISGPLCKGSCIEYPFINIISRFPRDYIWMYPAMMLTLLVVFLMVCIHYYAQAEKKVFSLTALCFTLISSTLLFVDYFIQVSVIQPSLVRGETEGIALLTQFNPHGIFIALEDAGYLTLAAAYLFTSFVFTGANSLERAIRWILLMGFILAFGSFILMTSIYGTNLEYRFEVTVIAIDWLVLIFFGILLSQVFKKSKLQGNLSQ
ncbi:MAG: hypothetical protein WCK09_20845 [Bacteroidota bacterium]